ncbi:GntR family transcriptional regulator [Pararcticibacter amylolyticus]|uniref:HTH gntR-type domain-containing protein n=1 Tax=Pararcticibacter amylolyticus TaxID=2173175 RepID=A0A2U2PKI6_9SPHI|nr:GntR family transcriptional regulator [Pararcticibacter amylolyticus]PWG81925.1 hypothetical protein DDR33_02515 [Pararcticibacter amylolyticus]
MNNPEHFLFFEFVPGTSRLTQVVEKIISEIKEEHFRPGDKLPTLKRMQEIFGVSHDTMSKAIKQLTAGGYIATNPRNAVYVLESKMHFMPRGLTEKAPYAIRMFEPLDIKPQYPIRKKVIRLDLDVPFPDNTLQAKLRAQCRKISPSWFPGNYAAHEQMVVEDIAESMARFRGVSLKTSQCAVIKGANTALHYVFSVLAARREKMLVTPGTIAPSVYHACRNSAFDVVRLKNTDNISFTTELLRMGGHERIGGVVLEPRYDYYGGVELPPKDRTALLDLADKYHFPVIEVDYGHEFLRGATPPLFAEDQKNAILVSCVSKLTHELYDLKFVCGPVNLIRSLRNMTHSCNINDDLYLSSASYLLKGFHLNETALKIAAEVRICGDILYKSLDPSFLKEVQVRIPERGASMFLYFPELTNMVEMKNLLEKDNIIIGGAVDVSSNGVPFKLLRVNLVCIDRKSPLPFIAEKLCDAYKMCRRG